MLDKNKWHVKLIGNNDSLKKMVNSLSSSNTNIIEDCGQFYLTAFKMQDDDNWANILEMFKAELLIINSAYKLVFNSYEEVRLGKLIPPEGVQLKPISASCSVDTCRIITVGDDEKKPLRLQQLIEASRRFREVHDVLLLMNNSRNFFSFYKVYEIIKQDCGAVNDQSLINKQYIRGDVLQNLKLNLNSRYLWGEYARHGKLDTRDDARKRMTFYEIEKTITDMVFYWIEDKLNNQ